MDAAALLRVRIAVACKGHQAVDKIGRSAGKRQRIPAQLIGWRIGRREVVGEPAVVDAFEWTMYGRRPDAIQPRASIGAARRRKRGARQLLGVQAVRAALW